MTDTSKLFIRMADCPEIQKSIPQDGVSGTFIGANLMYHTQSIWDKEHDESPEGVYWFVDEEYVEECPTCGNQEVINRTIKCIWIPDQRQLQQMSGLDWFVFDKACVDWATTNPEYRLQSKEQVGIKVMMREKFGKIWVNDKWLELLLFGKVDEMGLGSGNA